MHTRSVVSPQLSSGMDVVAQIYADMMSGKVADFLAKLSGGCHGPDGGIRGTPFILPGRPPKHMHPTSVSFTCLVHQTSAVHHPHADDVEWHVPGGSEAHVAAKLVPYAGIYKSKAAVVENYLPVRRTAAWLHK